MTARPVALLYYPPSATPPAAASAVFMSGERLEHVANDLTAAAREYARSTTSATPSLRAGALARLARVRRKQGDLDAALAIYAQLARLDAVDVDGLPAALVARVGRASIFERAGRTARRRFRSVPPV